MGVPVAQKERHTPGHQQLRELMEDHLGQRQGAFPHLDAQQPTFRTPPPNFLNNSGKKPKVSKNHASIETILYK
jgi:hypothetical protein